MSKLNYSYIGLGSNLGNKLENIHLAYILIQKKIGNICGKSSIYQTPPWGFDSKDDFYNSVILIETKLGAQELLTQLKLIESELGRDATLKIGYSSRVIDLDIIDFNNEIISRNDLVVPHPHIEKRNFVLYPLQEINSKWIHPKNNMTIENLIDYLNKTDEINRVLI